VNKLLCAVLALAAAPVALAQTQGVTDAEIVLGTAQDLSGPIVSLSKPVVNGMLMRVDEINAAGGINGRKLRLVVEDHGYDPKKAVLAAQKMTQRDRIFVTVGSIGTPTALAAMPIYEEKNVPHLFPLTGARQMFEPLHRLKYSSFAPYYEQMRAAVKYLVKQKGYKTVCTLYQDDDFGLEVMRGGEAALKDLGLKYAERTTYKRGATDFASQVSKMKAAGCDLIVMGTIVRETVGTIAAARKLGWEPAFVGSNASHFDTIHKLGKAAVNGFYAACTINVPYADDPSKALRDWFAAYQAKYGEDPTIMSAYGYQIVDTFAGVTQKAGRNLTVDTLVATLQSYSQPANMFGADALEFSKTSHLGSDRARLCQIQNERWVPVSEYLIH
jgi:branched-chain amino acid transport system substrate-binding protein